MGNLQGITQLTLAVYMVLLIVIQFVRQSTRMYKLTKRSATTHSRLGQYQELLVKEGLLYFIAYVHLELFRLAALSVPSLSLLGFGLDFILDKVGLTAADWRVLTLAMQQTLAFTLFPRFVMSLRRLHMRDLEERQGVKWTQCLISPEPSFLTVQADVVEDEERMP